MFDRLRDRRDRRNRQASSNGRSQAGMAYYDLRPRSPAVPDLGYTIVPVHPPSAGLSFDEILADIASVRWSGLVRYNRPEVSLAPLRTWAFEQGRILWTTDHEGKRLPVGSKGQVPLAEPRR